MWWIKILWEIERRRSVILTYIKFEFFIHNAHRPSMYTRTHQTIIQYNVITPTDRFLHLFLSRIISFHFCFSNCMCVDKWETFKLHVKSVERLFVKREWVKWIKKMCRLPLTTCDDCVCEFQLHTRARRLTSTQRRFAWVCAAVFLIILALINSWFVQFIG